MDTDLEKKLIRFLPLGAEIVGSVSEEAIGLIGAKSAVLFGAAMGPIITKGLTEIFDKQFSKREKIRISASVGVMAVGVYTRILDGENPRLDIIDFEKRTTADEIFEGIIIKCKNDHEEKKLRYTTMIFENMLFSTIDPSDVNSILQITQSLTYRHLIILSLIGSNSRNCFNLDLTDKRTKDIVLKSKEELILCECVSLYNHGLIHRQDHSAVLGTADIIPGELHLSSLGKLCEYLMSLNSMEKSEYDEVIAILR